MEISIKFVVLPPEITRDGMERPILISHPTMPLLVTDKGLPFVMQSRGAGQSPAAMNKLLDKLIEQAGLSNEGVSRISLVRTAVVESCRAGMSTSE